GAAPFLLLGFSSFFPLQKFDQHFVPPFSDCFHWRTNRSIVCKLNLFPFSDLDKRVMSSAAGSFGVNHSTVAQKQNATSILLHHLNGATATAQATHLNNVYHVKQVRRFGGG